MQSKDKIFAEPGQKALLDLIALGKVDKLIVDIVAGYIQSVAGIPTEVRPQKPVPDFAYLSARKQYDATKILPRLLEDTGNAYFKLALINKDLCIPIMTHVYGESQLGGRAAVVSLSRLLHADPQVTFQRIAKICLHEVGHLLGLEHCREIGCLMRFSKQLDQLDELFSGFCSACEYEILRRVAAINQNML